MAAIEPHWVYQGRQSHGWFGSGTGPGRDVAPAKPHYGDLFAPANMGNRVAGAAWYGARNLSRDAFRALLLDPSTKNSTVDRLRVATRGFVEARTPEVLNAANAILGDAVRRIGLDNWPAYLADAAKRAVAAVDNKDIPGVIKVGTADLPASMPGLAALGLLMLLLQSGKGQAPKTPPAPAPPIVVHQTPTGGDEKKAVPPQPQSGPARSANPKPGVQISEEKRRHILTGDPDGEGGGHKFGVGRPGKTEFPESWSDDKIIEEATAVRLNCKQIQLVVVSETSGL
jgi:hypothetical protein